MNIFSNIGITELIVILLLALLVVGPERLPELGRKLGTTLRDIRKAYDNLTRDLGPELASLQQSTQELRESFESVQSIPQDAVKSVVKAAELEDTVEELKQVKSDVEGVGQTLSGARRTIKAPVAAAVDAAREALEPPKPPEPKEEEEGEKERVAETADGLSEEPAHE
jgi:Tat protein translocase TatB subunit